MSAHDEDRTCSVARVETPRGDLVLRRRGGHYEIISNGVFLMDTRDGRSERLLVRAALDACAAPAPRLLIGGLGVGFSLAEAVRHARVAQVTVIEIEPAVIDWQAAYLSAYAENAADDPRVALVRADLLAWIGSPARAGDPGYDAICLDIDNGPQWTVTEQNGDLYGDAGLDALRGRLAGSGVLAVWSAHRSADFEKRLHRHFAAVAVHEVPVQRGEPDIIYVGTRVARR